MSIPKRYTHPSDFETAIAEIPYTLIACENAIGEILMLRRAKPPFVGMWNFLGGKIEQGELPIASAQRELGEETGQDIESRRIQYRGVALWPVSERDPTKLKGMHLFRVFLGAKSNISRQLSLLDEGTTAWLPKNLLHDGKFKPVPNFELLYAAMVRPEEEEPVAVFHWVTNGGCHDSWSTPIRSPYNLPESFPKGVAEIPVLDLAEFGR